MKQYLYFLLFCLIGVNAGVFAQGNQTVYNGNTTSIVNFGGCIYNWNNDNPGIGLAASGAGNIASFKAINAGSTPVVANITATPQPTENAYVPSSDNPGTITVINTATNQVTGTITVGNDPENVLAVDGNRLYVSNTLSNTVSVVNTVQGKVIATIGVGNFPYGLALSADKSTLYVSNVNSNTVSVISTATNTVTGTIPGFSKPFALAASPTGNLLYVANENAASISVVNTVTGTIIKTISSGNEPWQLTVSPDGSRIYVTNMGDNTVAVINAATNTVLATIPVDLKPEGIAISPDGTILYVGCFGRAEVVEINTATNAVIKRLTAASPDGLTVSADGKIIYVVDNTNPGSLSVINTTSGAPIATVPTGIYPAGYGHFVASVNCQPVKFSITVNPAITLPDQTVNNGQTTTAVSFPTGGCSYTWTNDHPEIGLPASGAGDISAFIATNTGSASVTATITATSIPVQYAYIPGGNGITVINTSTSKVVTTIPAGYSSANVAATPDGSRVYISDPLSNTVLAVNTTTNTITATIPVGNLPGGITVSPDGKKVFVGNYNDGSISVISVATNKVTATIYGFEGPFQLRTAPVGNILYVVSQITGVTYVVNTANNTVVNNIPFISGAWDIAISPDGSRLYIVSPNDNSVHVIDAASLSTITTIPVGLTPQHIAISPDGANVYVGCINAPVIAVISTATNTVTKNITAGGTQGLNVSADGKTLFAVDNNWGKLNVINIATGNIIATIPAGVGAIAAGNFLAGISCPPLTFTITVKATPAVIAGSLSGFINACVGSASASPQIEQFIVSGNNLNSGITATAPVGFEISASASTGFGSSVTLQPTNKTVAATTLYVRSAASAPAGSATGYVSFSSLGWTPSGPGVQVTANINPLPTANVVTNQMVTNGQSTTAISLTGTGKEFDWTNDTLGIGLAASGKGDISSFKAINTTSQPITATITVTATNPGYAYVTNNQHAGTVDVINTSDHSTVATIPVGSRPYGVAIDQAHNKVYIANDSVDYVSVIDAKTNKVVDTMYVGPSSVADCITPDGSTLYVGYQYGVVIINTATGKQITKIRDQSVEEMVASLDGKYVYVANYLTDQIDVISTTTNTIVSHINVNRYPLALLLSADGNTLFATSRLNNGGSISVVDLITQTMVATIPVDVYTFGMSVTPDGKKLYVNEPTKGLVAVADLTTNQVVKTITVGTSPEGSSMTSDGSEVYVTNVDSNNISIINTGTDQVTATIPNINTAFTLGNFISPGSNCASQPRKFTITVNPANSIANQIVNDGQATTAVNFPGCTYNWTNDMPGIGLAASGTGDISSFTAINKGTSPVVATITATPVSTGFAYIVNAGSNNVSVINTTTNLVVATIPVGSNPNSIYADSKAKKIYIVNNSSNSVSVIDPATNTVTTTIPTDATPWSVTASPDGTRAYVPCGGSNSVLVINTATDAIISRIKVGSNPNCVAVSPDGGTLYVGNSQSNNIYVVDAATGAVKAIVPVGNLPQVVLVTPDGTKVYEANFSSNNVDVISTVTNTVIASIPVGTQPGGGSISADSKFFYVANFGSNNVSVINTATNSVVATIGVGASPWGVAVTPDGKHIYVTNSGSNNVSIVDASTNKVTSTIAVGSEPYSFGTFFYNTTPCTPITFTITVNPAAVPTITTGVASGGIYACLGEASASPQVEQITVSANNLTGNITATAPPNFEISLNPSSGFASTLALSPTAGTLNNTIIYVRSAAGAPAGYLRGNVTFASGGAANQTVAVNGYVKNVPSVNTIGNQTVNNGQSTTVVVPGGTGTSYAWTNNTPGIGLAASGTGNIAAFTAVNNTASPITATITVTPKNDPFAYISNANGGNVSIVNTATDRIVGSITTGSFPFGVAASADGRVYVTDLNSNSVSVLDPTTRTVVSSIPLTGAGPESIAVSPDGSSVYVVGVGTQSVYVINTSTYLVTATIKVGQNPQYLSLSPDGTKLFVTNTGDFSLSVIDTKTNAVAATIPLGFAPYGLTAGMDNNTVYIADSDHDKLAVVNTTTSQIVASVPVGYMPRGVTVSPDGSRVYVANNGDKTVSVINTSSNTAIATINVGTSPLGMSVTGDGTYLYVANKDDGTVSVISTATNSVYTTIGGFSSPYAVGNFITPGTFCPGTPTKFTITVNPTATASPTIIASSVSGLINACVGTAAVSPKIEQFTVSGSNLKGNIILSVPAVFEISTSPTSGFGGSVTLSQAAGTVNSAVLYVRSKASAPVGTASGVVSISSAGWLPQGQGPQISETINPLPTINTVPNQAVSNGQATTAVSFNGTGNIFTWTNDTPGIGLPAAGTGDINSFNAVNTGSTPIVATITATPTNAGFAYVTRDDGTVAVINTTTNQVLEGVMAGSSPAAVSVSPGSNLVYISNLNSNNISVISTTTNKVVGTIPLSGAGPMGLVASNNGKWVYVADENSNQVSVINTATTAEVKTIAVGVNPYGIAISPDDSKVYVTNFTSGTVSVISTATNTVIATVTVGQSPVGVVVSADGSHAYVVNENSNNISVINTATNTVTSTITVGQRPAGIAIGPDKNQLYITNTTDGTVSIMSSTSGALIATVPVGSSPFGISVNGDGSLVYVANLGSQNVSVINTFTNSVVSTITTGNLSQSIGNFVINGTGCEGTPINFTITVNPTPPPDITATSVTNPSSACQGSPSVSPNIQQVALSGIGLSGAISLTAPNNFEISLSPTTGFGASLTINPAGGIVNSVPVYIRLAATAPLGNQSGNVEGTSPGAKTIEIPVNGTVNPSPVVNTVLPQTITAGQNTATVVFGGTGDQYDWVNDNPAIGLQASGTGNIASFAATNNGTTPITATITVTPSLSNFAYIANFNSNSVSVIKTSNNTIVTTIPVQTQPWGVATSPGNQSVYVSNQGSNSVSLINALSNTVTATVTVGKQPQGVALSPDGAWLYVSNSGDGTVSVVNTFSNTVYKTITVGSGPQGIAVNPTGTNVYVANALSNTVSVISMATDAVIATIPVGGHPTDFAISPDGATVYVTNMGSGSVSVINASSNTVTKQYTVGIWPAGICISPDGVMLYVANSNTGNISAINTSTGKIKTFGGTSIPEGVSLTKDGKFLYVNNFNNGTVSVYNTVDYSLVTNVNVQKKPNSDGRFIWQGTGCAGTPIQFTITVNPSPVQTTGIIVGPATGNMSACQGSASISPNIQQFTVSGTALTAPINLTAPNNFEISLSPGGGYGTSLSLPLAGSSVNNTIIYVRLAATAAPAGPLSGNVSLTSQGAQAKKVPVTGTVVALPAANPIQPLTVNSGDIVPAINFSGTGNVFNWTNNTTSIGLAASGAGSTPSFTAVNSTANPVTATVTVTPSSEGFAYIANYGSKSVSVINTANNTVVTSVTVGDSPWGVAVAPGGNNVYVTNQQSNTVSVINASSNTVTATIPVGSSPEGVALSPDGSTLYVANQQSNTVSVISTASNLITATVTVGSNPNVIAVSPPGSFVYVANQVSNSVSVINTGNNTVTATVPVGASPDGIAISPDGALVYVALANNTVSAISTSSNAVVKTYTVGTSPNEICVSPDGGTIYVSNSNSSNISVINTLTGAILTWTGFSTPDGLSLGSNGALLYVNNFSAGTVSVINTTTGNIVNTIPVGLFPGTKGNFTWQGTGCQGVPSTFTITVNPSNTSALITASDVTGSIFACFGTAAASPQIEQFTVAGSNLTGAISASASAGFEISLSANSGFATSLTIPQSGGTVGNTVIYVRSAANALAGHLTGYVALTSPGASGVNASVNGVVNTLPITNQPADQSVGNGTLTAAVNFSGTGNIFTWTNDNSSIGLAASGTGDIAPFIGINTTSMPVKANITVTPQAVAYAYVANSISNNVSVIEVSTGVLATTIPVGSYPCAVAVSPDGGKVYVANQRSNSISIISAASNTVTHTIQAGNNSPIALAISPDGQRLYVVNLNSNNVSVYSTSTFALVASFAVGGYPVAIAVTPDGNKVYVSNSSNSISVFNTNNSTVKTINAGQSPFGIAVTPDGTKVYAVMSGDNDVEVISTTTDAIVTTIPVGSNPAGVVITPDGASVYVSNQATNNVSVISTTTNKVFATVTVDINPLGMSVTSDGTEVYVANERSNTVSVINTTSNVASQLVNVGQYPISLGNFISAGVGCSGAPVTFTITVTPTLAPAISATGSFLPLTTTYGTPSANELFTVSGQNLTAGISVTAPGGFEISSNKSVFAPSLVISSGGGPITQTLYIRLAATTPVNTYAGDILITSTGAPSFKLAMPLSTVNPALLTIIADDKTKAYNAVNPPLTISYAGFVNFETPDVLTTPPVIATTATTSSPAGQYPITIGGAAAANYTISYLQGTLTILPPAVSLVIPNTFTPNGDGINDTWNIKQLELYANCSVAIFTRWGKQIYSSIGYSVPWDGSYKGAALPFGTYYYVIDLKNGITPLAGFVAIVK